MSPPIFQFQGQYRFLSNFYIEPDGSCVEVEYQAAKCSDPKERKMFFAGMFPGQAKRCGQKIKLRDNWDNIKVSVMCELVFNKFKDHPSLAEKLIATGNAELVEGNCWGDKFWGRTESGLGVGLNHLGLILMDVREDLRTNG